MPESLPGFNLLSRAMILGAAYTGLLGRTEAADDISNLVNTAIYCADFNQQSLQEDTCQEFIKLFDDELLANASLILASGAVMSAGITISSSSRRARYFRRTY